MAARDSDRDRRDVGGSRAGGAERRPRGVRRTTGRPAPPRREPRRRRRTVRPAAAFGLTTTRRAAVLAIVVCALALSVAVPLRTYLSQRDEVAVQQERQRELLAQVEALERRKAQLEDPAQVQAEARRRLRYVMPGETPYMVELPGDRQARANGEEERTRMLDEPWYLALWESVSGR